MKPKISVAIPVFKPELPLFRETLKSILNNGISTDEIEIFVVNDCPSDTLVSKVIGELSGNIKYYANDFQLGIAGNWNRCIELANGEWIHLLHQDDIVLPGFYQELLSVQTNNEIGAFATRFFIINEKDHITSISRLELDEAGILEDATHKIITTNTIQCPSIVVKKNVYSTIGKFNPELKYALDWEMWFRVSLKNKIWYTPKPLACYRMHSGSEASRLKQTGDSARDMIKGVNIVSACDPSYEHEARVYGVNHIIGTAIEFLLIRKWKEAAIQLRLAPICLPSIVFNRLYFSCWFWLLKIVLKNKLMQLIPAR